MRSSKNRLPEFAGTVTKFVPLMVVTGLTIGLQATLGATELLATTTYPVAADGHRNTTLVPDRVMPKTGGVSQQTVC